MKNITIHVFVLQAVLQSSKSASWKDGYYRGVGLASSCPAAYPNKINGLCYQNCPTGWSFFGTDCTKDCPPNWSTGSGGSACTISGNLYGRGTGYWSMGDCLTGGDSVFDVDLGCQQVMLMYYPRCTYGYTNSACCICDWFDGTSCPLQTTRIGSGNCLKNLVPSPSTLPNCNLYPGLVLASDALCYPACLPGFDGTDICWRQACPAGEASTCNQALCTANSVCSGAETTATNSVLASVAASISSTGQFNMEDIVRGLSATIYSVANGMSNEQTFPQQDISRAAPYECNKRRFPVFLGATSGETSINTFEFDLNSNIAVAGSSTDTLFVSASGSTFLGILENTAFNFTWMVEISSSTQLVQQLAFSPDGTQLAALLTGSPLTMLVFSSASGAMLSQLIDPSAQFQANGKAMNVDPTSGWINLIASDLSSNLLLIGLNLFKNPIISTPISSILKITENQVPWSMTNGEPGKLYVGSHSNLPQSPPSSSYAQGFSISEFALTLTPTSWTANYVNTQYNAQNYIPKQMTYSNFGLPNNAIYLVADSGAGGVMIIRRQIANNLIDAYSYQEHNNDPLQTLDILPFNFGGVFIIIKNTLRDTLFTLTLNFATSSLTISKKLQVRPFITQADSMFARLVSTGDYFISGRMLSFGANPTCMVSTGNNKGFIASTESDSLTQTFSFIDQMTSSTQSYTSITHQVFAFTPTSISLILSQTGSTVVPIIQSKLYQVQNTCNMKAVTTTVMPYHRYIIDYPVETYQLSPFTLTPSICTDTFKFTYQKDSLLTIPSSPLIGESIFFDDVKLTFKAETSDSTHAGVYQIRVISQLPNHQVDIGTYFPIELFNIPPATKIFGNPMNDQTYIVTDTRLNFSCTPFLSSDTQYYIIYYMEVYDSKLGAWTRNLDPQIINFTQGGKAIDPTVYAVDNTKIGVYEMRLVAKFTPHTAFESVSYFKLIIQHQCYLTVLLPSNDLPTEVTFYMSFPPSPQKVFGFSPWREKLGICAPFAYKASFADGSFLPDFLSFNPILRQFVLSQTRTIAPGSYPILVRGSLANYYLSNTQSFTVIVKCTVSALTTAQTNQRINFVAGSPIMQLSVGEFIQTPSCGKDVSFQAVMESGAPINTKYLSLEETETQIGLIERFLTFQAPAGSLIRDFPVLVKATINPDGDGQVKVMSMLKFQFTVVDDSKFTETQYPDISTLIKAGNAWVNPFVKMPSAANLRLLQSSELRVTFTKQVLKLISGELSANSGQLVPTDQPQVQYDPATGMLIATPAKNTEHGTQYVIRAEILDAKKFKITQDIALTVYRSGGGGAEDFEDLRKQLLELQQLSYSQLNAKKTEKSVLGDIGANISVSSKPDLDFKLRIAKIDEYGLVTIRFNKPLIIPQNISLINTEVLTVNVTSYYRQSGYFFDERNLNFTWVIQDMTEKMLSIQLSFESPLDVSSLEILDTLKVSVNQSEFFITQQQSGVYAPIPRFSSASKKVPAQTSSDDEAALRNVKSFSTSVFGLIFGNALISILLSSSISSLWSLIHVAQLMMTIPLMNIQLPASAQMVFLTMQNIISFDFVDTDQIPLYSWFFEFPDEDSEEAFNDDDANELTDEYTGTAFNQRFELYGYEYKNTLRNMGSGFVWFVLSLFYQAIVFMVWRFFTSVEVTFKSLDSLQRSLFFTMFISTFYEGTLEMTICGTVNVLYPEWTNNTDYLSSIFSIVSLATISAILLISLMVAYHVPKNGKKPYKRLKTLYDGLKTRDRFALYYTPVSIVRRVIIVFSVMFLPTLLQPLVFIAQSAFTVAFLLKYQPFSDQKIMKLEIFNECMLLLCANLTLGFVTDLSQVSTPGAISTHGWVLSGVMLFTVFINTTIATIEQIMCTYASFKYLFGKLKKYFKTKQQKTVPLQPNLNFGTEQVKLDSFYGDSPLQQDKNTVILQTQYRQRRLLKLMPLAEASQSHFHLKETGFHDTFGQHQTNSKLFSTLEDEENKVITRDFGKQPLNF